MGKRVIHGKGNKSKNQETWNQVKCLELQSNTKHDFADNEWEKQAYMGWAKQDNNTEVNVIMDEESGQWVMGDVVCEGMTIDW